MLVGVGLGEDGEGEEWGEGGDGEGEEVGMLPALRKIRVRRLRGRGKMRIRLRGRIIIGGIRGLGRWLEVGSLHEMR